MLSILATAERTGNYTNLNNYLLSRHIFAYINVQKYLSNIVLEVGCGNCYGMKLLAENCQSYIGIDKFMPRKLEMKKNTAFFKTRLPILKNIGDNSYDTIVCFQVIEHIKHDHLLLSEMKRVLKPGGRLILTTPNKDMSLTRNPYHQREYNCQEITTLLKQHFHEFSIMGIYARSAAKDYYERNKKNVAAITRFDILNLQHILPAFFLKLPYNIMNNLNRIVLFQKNTEEAASITHNDFYIDKLSKSCFDYFVVAKK